MHVLTRKFLPRLAEDVVHERLPGHRVFSGVACGAAEENDLLFAYDGDCVAKSGLGHLAVDLHGFDDLCHVDLLSDRLARSVVPRSRLERVGSCTLCHRHITRRGSATLSLLGLTTESDCHRGPLCTGCACSISRLLACLVFGWRLLETFR